VIKALPASGHPARNARLAVVILAALLALMGLSADPAFADLSIPAASAPSLPAAVPSPVLGQEVDVAPVSGVVFVKTPPGTYPAASTDLERMFADPFGTLGEPAAEAALTKGQGFVQLTEARQIPTGSQIDAREGTLELTAAAGSKQGSVQTGTFSDGIFKVAQDSQGINKGLTTLSLLEAAFPGAPTYASCPGGKALDGSRARTAVLSAKVLQALLATAHGRFRTKGRFSAATVRGTKWGVRDRCDGTLTIARRGTVVVSDFVRHVTIVLHAGHSYLARAPSSRYGYATRR